MRKFLKSKLFISVLLLLLAGILVFGGLPKLYGSQAETMEVVQCISDINIGTQITDSMLVVKTIGKYGVDNTVLTSKEQVLGKYATNDIHRGVNLYSDMFTDNYDEVEGALDMSLKPGEKLVTKTLSTGAQSVAGKIKAGSWVDIYTQVETEPQYDEYGYPIEDAKVEMTLTPLLTHVRVYQVMNNALEDISELNRKQQLLQENGSDEELKGSLVPVNVTFIATDEQAAALVNQEYSGQVHLVMYPEGYVDAPEQTEDKEKPAEGEQTEDVTGGEEQPGAEGEEVAPQA